MLIFFALSRTVKLLIISVISSLPFAIMQVIRIDSKVTILISFILFLLLAARDAYVFSYNSWEETGAFEGVILPYLFVLCISIICFFTLPAFIFNFILLPIRFAECFGVKTIISIVIISLFMGLFSWAISLLGYRTAKKDFYEYSYYDGEDTLKSREENFTSEE